MVDDNTSYLSKVLGLPEWFDPTTCVIVINSVHREQFKEYSVDWLVFSDYIMYGEMIVMDKTQPFTALTQYSKGDLNGNPYKRTR